jgi:superoxide reductase
MSELHQIFKCESCDMIGEVVHASKQGPSCCGSRMKYLVENSTDAAKEKHVPVIEKVAGGFKVTIGSTPHPMEDKHFIEWIEIIADGLSYKIFLKPGMPPSATFKLDAAKVVAREFCTVHGLWRAEAQ